MYSYYSAMQTILLIEDDPDIVHIVKSYFQQSSFNLEVAFDGPTGLAKALNSAPDLILLDWMLPGLDGLELLKRLRNERRIPVIMITARTEEIDRIMGLEFGADDYLTKPFSVRELVARARAVLRRSTQIPQVETISQGQLNIDPQKREAFFNKILLNLTTLEFDLLLSFMEQPGRVFSRDDLLIQVWGRDFEGIDRVVDVHVSNLRKKLEAAGATNLLQTIRGIGYKLVER